MLTNDKSITEPSYWDRIYTGKNDNAPVDASNLTRPKNAFDRFGWVAEHAEGHYVLEVAAGHAHISKRIKAKNPKWVVIASDQTPSAETVARFQPYFIFTVYDIPFVDKKFQTIIISQALEYVEHQEKFLEEARRVAHKIIITLPIGEMKLWSQLRIYTEENVKELLLSYGDIEVFDRQGDLLLVKLKFN